MRNNPLLRSYSLIRNINTTTFVHLVFIYLVIRFRSNGSVSLILHQIWNVVVQLSGEELRACDRSWGCIEKANRWKLNKPVLPKLTICNKLGSFLFKDPLGPLDKHCNFSHCKIEIAVVLSCSDSYTLELSLLALKAANSSESFL